MPDHPASPFVVTAAGGAGLARSATRSSAFRRPSRALRIPASLSDDTDVRARAVALASRSDAVFWGPTAAELLGLPLPYRLQDLDVHVLVPEGMPRPRRVGVRPRQADIVTGEISMIDGLPVTSPARTFVDLAAFVSLPDLVAIGDVVQRRYRTSVRELSHVHGRRLRYPGKVLARKAIPLLDPRAESPQESRLRIHLIEDGLPCPQVNMVITDESGGFIARGDLVYDRWRIVIEYDGEVHGDPIRRMADATRRTLLRELDWYVVEIVAGDLRQPHRARAKVRAALRSRGAI